MFFSWAVFSGSPKHFLRLNSVLKSIHSLKTFVCCLKTMGAFKSYEIIVCCLITPPNFPRRERFETSFIWVRWGAMVGLEAR
ncbi:hypothetical protein [Helicobacter pylori]|uniref:hypothetical protein n=1 Tax=Helicobacter pylori TaxID=210 RepID=UPI0019695490|nr:hypothetical protein [Helicobacter pylori]